MCFPVAVAAMLLGSDITWQATNIVLVELMIPFFLYIAYATVYVSFWPGLFGLLLQFAYTVVYKILQSVIGI